MILALFAGIGDLFLALNLKKPKDSRGAFPRSPLEEPSRGAFSRSLPKEPSRRAFPRSPLEEPSQGAFSRSLCATLDLRKKQKSWKAAPPKIYIFKKNQYFRTIGPSMAPLELLSKRQAVVFKAPCAYIGPPAIYIGLEPVLEKKISICFLLDCPTKKIWIFVFSIIGSRPI